MTPKELRLDNWVLYDGRPFKIYGISKEYPFLDTIEFGVGVVEWKDLQPIPLTEEWLLKFGFEVTDTKREQYFMWVNRGRKLRVLRGIKRVGYKFFAASEGFYFDCNYVHQLQNLYWCLTGHELEIDL